MLDLTRDMFNRQQGNLAPYAGVGNIAGAHAQAQPSLVNTLAGQNQLSPFLGKQPDTVGGNRAVGGPTMNALPQAREVAVNQNDLFDPNNRYLQAMNQSSDDKIESMMAARGKLGSGGTMEEIANARDANYVNYANALQGIESARDQASLASDMQRFGQGSMNQGTTYGQSLGANQFANLLNQQGFGNALINRQQMGQEFGQDFTRGLTGNDLLYNQLFGNNQQTMTADQIQGNQLGQVMGIGAAAAGAQGNNLGAITNQLSTLGQNAGGDQAMQRLMWGQLLGGMF